MKVTLDQLTTVEIACVCSQYSMGCLDYKEPTKLCPLHYKNKGPCYGPYKDSLNQPFGLKLDVFGCSDEIEVEI